MNDATPLSADMQRAKRPRSPLAGLYGHPIHPILVTDPHRCVDREPRLRPGGQAR